MAADSSAVPSSLQRARPLFADSIQAKLALRRVFADHGGFQVFLDDACDMPRDWRSRLYIGTGNRTSVDDRKYGAESALPHMLAASPFVTSDWRRANASLVVLYTHRYGGPVFGPDRCRRALEQRSAAWRASGGARHFFVVTSDFGPCDHTGHLLSPALLGHHLIVTHGELDGHHWHWGEGPNLPCFCAYKDVSIPPAMWIHPPGGTATTTTPDDGVGYRGTAEKSRDLLAFFAGAGEFRNGKRQGRQLMLRIWGDRADPEILAVWRLPREEMLRSMARSKFCPIFGGNSPWSTRLVEAMQAGCVPVFFSSWLPPFSRLLDWARFSVRVASLDLVPQLKTILKQQPYERLAANLPLALGAMWYRADGNYRGDDLVPFLLVEMHMALRAASERSLALRAQDLIGLPLQLTGFDDDVAAKRSSPLSNAFPLKIASAIRRAPHAFPPAYHGGMTIVTNRSERNQGEVVWRCVPMGTNGHSYHATDPLDINEVPPGEADSKLVFIEHTNCILVHPSRLHKAARIALDPMSPTQVPANYSIVRANREWVKGPTKVSPASRP